MTSANSNQRFVTFSSLSPEEEELLKILSEEAAEVIMACSKVLRHGWMSFDPTVPKHGQVTNRSQLEKEIGHLQNAVSLLIKEKALSRQEIEGSEEFKRATIDRWLHYAKGAA